MPSAAELNILLPSGVKVRPVTAPLCELKKWETFAERVVFNRIINKPSKTGNHSPLSER